MSTTEPATPTSVSYHCNICGAANASPGASFHRELVACAECGSNARFRGVIAALGWGLSGGRAGVPLTRWPATPTVRGIGMSDSPVYAERLAKVTGYVNTFYDTDPKLDITAAPADLPYKDLDFIISTDVFEHVAPPLSRAFDSLWAMLKPGGLLVFSVPYTNEEFNLEHFPDLFQWSVVDFQGTRVLVNRDRQGRLSARDQLLFHGGSGATIELRVFGRGAVMRELRASGFTHIVEHSQPQMDIGCYWPLMHERAGQPPVAGYIITAVKPAVL